MVKPIKYCLEFARSEKKMTDQIGENGVGLKQSIVYLASSGVVISRNGSTFGVALVSKKLNLSNLIPFSGHPAFPRVEFTLPGHQPSLEDVRRELNSADLGDWPLTKWAQFLYGVDLSICVWDAIKETNDIVKRKLASSEDGPPHMEKYSNQEVYSFLD